MNQNRQPKGIPVGGQFAATVHGESDVSLVDVPDEPDYSAWTPVDVDTELARLYGERSVAMTRWSQQMEYVSGDVARSLGKRGYRARATRDEVEAAVEAARAKIEAGEADYTHRSLVESFERAEAYRKTGDDIAEQMEPLDAEFESRGGWPRAFLVVGNSGGHVHSSMDCSTCFRQGYDGMGNWRDGTKFHWVTDMSGKSEDEIVDAAGERCCTVCYKSAPVETLNKPTSLFTPDEIQKVKDREAREIAKKEREAKKIANGLTADGSEFEVEYVSYGRPGRERFKTERAASQWVVQHWAWDRDNPEQMASYQPAFDAVMQAVATKHGKSIDEVRAEFEKKMKAKRKRDGEVD